MTFERAFLLGTLTVAHCNGIKSPCEHWSRSSFSMIGGPTFPALVFRTESLFTVCLLSQSKFSFIYFFLWDLSLHCQCDSVQKVFKTDSSNRNRLLALGLIPSGGAIAMAIANIIVKRQILFRRYNIMTWMFFQRKFMIIAYFRLQGHPVSTEYPHPSSQGTESILPESQHSVSSVFRIHCNVSSYWGPSIYHCC